MTVSPDMAGAVVDLAAQEGLRVPDDLITGTDRGVDRSRYHEIWRALESAGGPDVGIKIARRLEPGRFGVLEYVMRNSPNVRAALYRMRRHAEVLYGGVQVGLTVDGNDAYLHFSAPLSPRAAVDFMLGVWRTVLSQMLGPDFRCTWLRLEYPSPADTALLESFFACRSDFLQPETALVFDATVLDRAVEGADSRLHELLCQYLPAPSPQDVAVGFPVLVENAIDRALADGVSLERVADDLSSTPAVVQRRLRDECDTTFSKMLQSRREAIAKRLLADPSVTIAEAAHLLGYADSSNFVRAFKKWTGASPSSFRAS